MDQVIPVDHFGSAHGVSSPGGFRWGRLDGSKVETFDVSAEGKCLVVATFAGFLSIFDLDGGQKETHQIGVSKHAERRRRFFCSDAERLLIW